MAHVFSYLGFAIEVPLDMDDDQTRIIQPNGIGSVDEFLWPDFVWTMQFDMPPDFNGELGIYNKLRAHMRKHGHSVPFQVTAPQPWGTLDGDAPTLVLSAKANVGATRLHVNVTGTLSNVKEDRHINVNHGSDKRMYAVDAVGAAYLDISPPLFKEAPAGSAVLVDDPDVEMRSVYDSSMRINQRTFGRNLVERRTVILREAP